MNSALALPMLKTKMGPTNIQFFLACLNVMPLSLETLNKVLSKATKIAKEENERSMIEKQKYVNKVQELKGQGNKCTYRWTNPTTIACNLGWRLERCPSLLLPNAVQAETGFSIKRLQQGMYQERRM